MTYIDIHTHQYNTASNVLSIYNFPNFQKKEDIPLSAFSISAHPWYVDTQPLLPTDYWANNPNLIAIGECGLDRICKSDWELQKSTFTSQIELANQLNKPMIIHAVRAIDECLQMLQHCNKPAIFHGMNVRKSLIEKILQEGHYISINKSIFQTNSPCSLYPTFVPIERIFLETDNASCSIQSVYEKYAEISEIEIEELILQILKNYDSFI